MRGARISALLATLACLAGAEATAAGPSTTTTPAPPTLTTTVVDAQVAHHCSTAPSASCGPRVLRCSFLRACECPMTPADLVTRACPCCEECIRCLGEQLLACCACVGLCELSPASPADALEADLDEDEPLEEFEIEHFAVVGEALGLFEKTFAPMTNQAWQMYTFAVAEEPGPLGRRVEPDVARSLAETTVAANCTVIYLDECASRKACAEKCKVMQASSFRWFVTGCCECAGEHCLAGGSEHARCHHCRHEDFPQIDEEDEEEARAGILFSQLEEL